MSSESKETNINVVVRVRPRNQKEIRENSPIVISTSGVKGKDLHVKANPSDPQSKTYSFDKVFGPDADQQMVYDEVVAPILEEVLMGYNCTIFAYGQTGTGKTHTMEGDLTSCAGKDAGIIPRTLYRLFDKLEKEDSEYSVRVSFLEIYNEELRDLLSPDDPTVPSVKLKIFEDMNRRGSNEVQGMEKILVNSAQDVITILQKGSNKRQTAATKMNEASSRSHCIFTITVHIKETTSDGEDLLKVGKLNLVDLAGSENVGRSGAEKGRAKEAGMINQSLLTLGRVINALVEKGLHIPYRESKLTRLLQDSLGGKTKTCIVAAVSPAKCNLEESLSTLDYAHRAKNIRNKPEVNQRMTKKALIREYETQIERLKMDLQATRDKNGVYLAAETYKDLVETTQSRKDRIDEIERTVLAKEDAITKMEADYAEQLSLLEQTRTQLRGTREELHVQTQHLTEALGRVGDLQKDLVEQRVLTDAHSTTESSLHSLHTGLVSFTERAVSDNYGLHAKIERKSAVEISNMRLFNDLQNNVMRQLANLETAMGSFSEGSSQVFGKLGEGFGRVKDSGEQSCKQIRDDIKTLLDLVSKEAAAVEAGCGDANEVAKNGLSDMLGYVLQLCTRIEEQQKFNEEGWAHEWNHTTEAVHQLASAMRQWCTDVRFGVSNLISSVDATLKSQAQRYHDMHDASLKALQDEIALLKSQNVTLQETIAAQQAAQTDAQATLLASISSLVQNFSVETNARSSAIGAIAVENQANCIQQQENAMTLAQERCVMDLSASKQECEALEKSSCLVSERIESGLLELESNMSVAENVMLKCGTEHQAGGSRIVGLVQESRINAEPTYSVLCEKVDEVQAHQQDHLKKMLETVNDDVAVLDRKVTTFGDFVETSVVELISLADSHIASQQSYASETSQTISQTRSEVQCSRLTLDEPTGKTPRKRKLQVPTDWIKTRPHMDLLAEFRKIGQPPSVAYEPVSASTSPVHKKLQMDLGSDDVFVDASSSVDDSADGVEVENEGPTPVIAPAVEKVSRTMGKIRGVVGGSNAGNAMNGTTGGVALSKLPTMKTRASSRGEESGSL